MKIKSLMFIGRTPDQRQKLRDHYQGSYECCEGVKTTRFNVDAGVQSFDFACPACGKTQTISLVDQDKSPRISLAALTTSGEYRQTEPYEMQHPDGTVMILCFLNQNGGDKVEACIERQMFRTKRQADQGFGPWRPLD